MLDTEEGEGCEMMWGAREQQGEKSRAPQEGAGLLTAAPGKHGQLPPAPAGMAGRTGLISLLRLTPGPAGRGLRSTWQHPVRCSPGRGCVPGAGSLPSAVALWVPAGSPGWLRGIQAAGRSGATPGTRA